MPLALELVCSFPIGILTGPFSDSCLGPAKQTAACCLASEIPYTEGMGDFARLLVSERQQRKLFPLGVSGQDSRHLCQTKPKKVLQEKQHVYLTRNIYMWPYSEKQNLLGSYSSNKVCGGVPIHISASLL